MRTRFLLSTAVAALALGLTSGRLSAQGATSVCKDGTTSAATGKGACSGHGGVDTKATAAAKKGSSAASTAAKTTPPATAAKSAPPTPPPAATKSAAAAKSAPAATKTVPATKTATASEKDSTGAVAACKDGTYSHAATHKGACSRHGGVAKFLKP